VEANFNMLSSICVTIFITIFVLLAATYRKGQKDGEKTLLLKQFKNKYGYKKVKNLEEIKNRLEKGKF
jgi:hypothetical protein